MDVRTSNVERELKLGAPSGFSLARLPQQLKNYVASPARFVRLHTVYYDTDDFRLMRWGCSLRYRRGDGWTLKIPVIDASGDGLARVEHAFPGNADRIPQDALELATAFLRGAPVRRVAELRTLRVKRDFRDGNGDPVAEVVEDDVRVVDGTHVSRRFAQIEIELTKDADTEMLDGIATILRDVGAGKPDPVPKNARALESDGAPEIDVPAIGEHATIGEVVRAAFGEAVVQFVRCDPLLRTSNDVEAVHKARVAIRKLRSHLHSFVPVLDEAWALGLRERLRWLQDALAPVRDADVFAERMRHFSAQLPHADIEPSKELLDSFDARARAEHDTLRATLRDSRYISLLVDMVDAARNPKVVCDQEEGALSCCSAIMQKAYKKARKRVRSAGTHASDRELHGIRIRSKHLRYAAEAFSGTVGSAAADYARDVESLQALLGDQHDGVVAINRLRAFEGSPQARFAAGELAMLANAAGVDALTNWRTSWNKIKSKRNRFW
jgi:CHAD domain-containing protein